MAGGSSHQRIVEKTRRQHIEQEIKEIVSQILGGTPVAYKETPWYETGRFWGGCGAFISIVLTVVAAMEKDVRWLLLAALPFAVLSWSVICRPLKKSIWHWRRILLLLLVVVTGIGLWGLYTILPKPETASVSRSPSPQSTSAIPLTANPLEVVDFNSSNDISVADNSLLPVYAIRLLVNIAEPKSTKSFGLDFDIEAGKTTTHHIGDGFHNVRSLSLLADTWTEHVEIATKLYGSCGIQLSFFSPNDPAFQQIKSAHSENKRGLAYQETTGVIYYRVRGLEGTSKQTVPIIVTTTVNGDTCPRLTVTASRHPKPMPSETPKIPSEVKSDRISEFLKQSGTVGTIRIVYFGNDQPELVDILLKEFRKGGWQTTKMNIGSGSMVGMRATEPLYVLSRDANSRPTLTAISALGSADMDAPLHPGLPTLGPGSAEDVTIVINTH